MTSFRVRGRREGAWRHISCLLTMMFLLPSSGSADRTPSSTNPAALVAELQGATGGRARVAYDQRTGLVQFVGTTSLTSGLGRSSDLRPEPAARSFLRRYSPIFGIRDQAAELTLQRVSETAQGRAFSRFQQMHRGVPVLGGELIVQTDREGNALSAGGKVAPALNLDTAATFPASRASTAAREAIARAYNVGQEAVTAATPSLWIYDARLLGMRFGTSSLVWRTEVTVAGRHDIRELVLIDAFRGFIALRFNQVACAKYRLVYNAGNTYTEGGILVRPEGGPATGDPDADNAYRYSGYTYDFYLNEHGRDGIDNAGMPMISTVHYGVGYQNAFWNGTQMVFGDGFTSALDVVAHELTHGVTEHTSGLIYLNQSGAINESFSDVWGNLIQLTYESTTVANRWAIGESLPSGAIRDMATPALHGDPDRMSSGLYQYPSWPSGTWDNGGVHSNSGVNNKACFLMVDGGTFNGQTVSGLGISKVADLYYEAQVHLLTPASDYPALYNALLQAAVNLGYSAADQAEIKKALDAVEMSQQPALNESADPVVGSPAFTLLYDGFEQTEPGKFHLNVGTAANLWFSVDFLPTASGSYVAWGLNQDTITDHSMPMTRGIALPAGIAPHLYFKHAFDFEPGGWDGGVVEYSTNGGSTWVDAGPLFTQNGYNGTILAGTNPIGGRSGFVNSSNSFPATNGYAVSKMNLAPLAGHTVQFRFRIGTDHIVGAWGWFVDDVRIYMVQAAAIDTADLNRVLVAPNPYNPHSRDANQGRPYEPNNWATGIIFHNVTNTVDIDIYTVQGRIVARLHGDNTNGRLQWNVRSSDGRDVESGVYIAVIRSPSGQKVTRRFMVIR